MAATKGLDKVKKAENENSSEGQAKLGGKEYEREFARLYSELGSGLIDHSQNMTAAAIQIAEK